ncbi:hypothetical protein C9Z85_20865 [Escherichia coli]|nr:hypothetical protein C9Z85_20865 [Escherichia coli]
MIWQPEFTDKTLSRKTGAVQSRSGIVHFCEAAWIASHTTFFTESSVGNTLRFLMACRITLFSDSMALVV